MGLPPRQAASIRTNLVHRQTFPPASCKGPSLEGHPLHCSWILSLVIFPDTHDFTHVNSKKHKNYKVVEGKCMSFAGEYTKYYPHIFYLMLEQWFSNFLGCSPKYNLSLAWGSYLRPHVTLITNDFGGKLTDNNILLY